MIWRQIFGLGCFLLSAACATPVERPQLPRFEPVAADDNFPVTVPASFRSTRGWLVVAEDRDAVAPREIRLPVAIVHGKAATPEADAVLYLSGGPGVGSLNAARYPGAYPWTASRDFVVLGQRGTEHAQPALMCPEYRDAAAEGRETISAIGACRNRLTAEGIDLSQYHSTASATDVEELRQVLGYEKWSLYGTSYGTRLALETARQYPDNIRVMVLDSPLPPNAIYDDEGALNFEDALRGIAQDCAAQPDCAAAYPDLEARFFRTLLEVEETPIVLEKNSASPTIVDGAKLAASVNLSSREAVLYGPYQMEKVARRDPDWLSDLTERGGVTNFAWGMRFSVWCSEALPFSSRSTASGPGNVLGGYESAAILPSTCAIWDVPTRPESFIEPVSSAIPTLIIAGEFDILTPPKWGKLAAATLPNSLVVTMRGGSHTETQQWDGDGCAMALAAAFVLSPQTVLAEVPGAYCAFEAAPPPYVLPEAD